MKGIKKVKKTNEIIDQEILSYNLPIKRIDDYINTHTKINWQCLININHKLFESPHYLLGNALTYTCKFCRKELYEKEQFEKYVTLANLKHNNKFIYNKTYLKENNSRVLEIVCKIHGNFIQEVHYHILGGSCTECYHDSLAYSFDEYIELANKVHNNLYQYLKLERTPHEQTIYIYCSKHNHNFNQKVSAHLHGDRCPLCTKEKVSWNFEEVIPILSEIHNNKYTYFNLISKLHKNGKNYKYIIYKCNDHEIIEQSLKSHLSGKGCHFCKSRISKGEKKWLDEIGLPNTKEYRNVKLTINGSNFFVDGLDLKNNVIYEYLGDYYHGNLTIYKRGDFNKTTKCTYGELFDKTIKRFDILKVAGYQIIFIWEKDFKQNKAFSIY